VPWSLGSTLSTRSWPDRQRGRSRSFPLPCESGDRAATTASRSAAAFIPRPVAMGVALPDLSAGHRRDDIGQARPANVAVTSVGLAPWLIRPCTSTAAPRIGPWLPSGSCAYYLFGNSPHIFSAVEPYLSHAQPQKLCAFISCFVCPAKAVGCTLSEFLNSHDQP
jgi:hypothetical protein